MIYPENRPKLGVALSGGGARGLAHIGILKVLRNADIQIDFMAGSSMGGVIAASYAAGLAPSEIEEIASSVGTISNLAQLVDPTLLKKGIFFPPSQYEVCFVSYAHSRKDIEKTVSALESCLKELG